MLPTVLCAFPLLANTESNQLPKNGWAYDTLENTSNLTDEEIMWYRGQGRYTELKGLLDADRDGVADGTSLEVSEFIERMVIVIGTKEYFRKINRPVSAI